MILNLFVFRHAETIDNNRKIFSGHRDPDLTQKGIIQAMNLSEKLRKEKIDMAFCSPLNRTMHTMEAVLVHHRNCYICIDERLKERDYGWLQGLSKEKFAKLAKPIFKLFHRSYLIPPPGGESLRIVRQRTNDFIYELLYTMKKYKKNVVICTHSNTIRAFREYFEGIPKKAFTKMETHIAELFHYKVEV